MKNESNITGYPSIDKLHEKEQKFFEKNPIIPNVSIYNTINLISQFYKKEYAVDCLDLRVTYDEMIKNSIMISKSLKELGIKSKDIITVSMPNFYQAIAIFLAANRIGATVTFLNSFSSIDEVKHYLNLFESPLLINYNTSIDYNQSIKKDTRVKNIITLKSSELDNKQKLSSNGMVGYSDYLNYSDLQNVSSFYKNKFSNNIAPNNDALILFTSGTTGAPKSVVLTNKNILSAGIYLKNSSKVQTVKGEKSLVCVPFTYPYGFSTSTLMSLICGREVILAPDLSGENISNYYDKKPNIVFGSPALLELTKKMVKNGQDLSSVNTFISGGDFLTLSQAEDGRKFFEEHNATVDISNGSGNAETVSCGTNAFGIKSKPETVGKILTGSSAIIIDPDTGKELKYNEEGLLCISGKHVFKEYYKDHLKTEDAKFMFKGKEYFKTGTMGFLDKEGYFTLTGRESRFYIMSTLNKVYCDRIQNILSSINIIDSVAVVKKKDDDKLFVNKAFIVLKDGFEANEKTLEHIKEMCTRELYMPKTGEVAQLKEYEIPQSFEFVDSLPRTKADKIDYPTLEKNAEEEYENENSKKLVYIKK